MFHVLTFEAESIICLGHKQVDQTPPSPHRILACGFLEQFQDDEEKKSFHPVLFRNLNLIQGGGLSAYFFTAQKLSVELSRRYALHMME